MALTVADVNGLAPTGTEKIGNPDFLWDVWSDMKESPFLASSEITAPADDLLAPAISFAAARIESSISSVVLI
jgi:hypothetical protein